MDILVIVNQGPRPNGEAGDFSPAMTALRFVRAALKAGHKVPAVFFQGEGINNAIERIEPGDHLQPAPNLWQQVTEHHHIDLLLCSAAVARRLDKETAAKIKKSFCHAGLATMWDIAGRCDRVVTF